MQNSIWKLTALAGVVGIGVLVLLQTQRGLTTTGQVIEEVDPVLAELGAADDLPSDEFGAGDGNFSEFEQFEPGELPPQTGPGLDESDPALQSAERFNPFADDPLDDESHPSQFEMPSHENNDQAEFEPDIFTAEFDETPVNVDTEHRSTNPQITPVSNGPQLVAPDSPKLFSSESVPVKSNFFDGYQATSDRDRENDPDSAAKPVPMLTEVPARSVPLFRVPKEDFQRNPFETNPDDEFPADDASPTDNAFPMDDAFPKRELPKFSRQEPTDTANPTAAQSRSETTQFQGPNTREWPPSQDGPGPRIIEFGHAKDEPAEDEPAEDEPALDAPTNPLDSPNPDPRAFGSFNPQNDGPLLQPTEDHEPSRTNRKTSNRLDPPPKKNRRLLSSRNGLKGNETLGGNSLQGPQRPQLNIEKRAPANAILGKPLVYSILVKNVGDSIANQVVIEDRVPKGSKLVGTIPQASMDGKLLVWKIDALKPGETKKISVRVIPLSQGKIGSVARVKMVTEVASQTLITSPKLELSMGAPKQAVIGQPVTFHFKVTNTGSSDVTGVIIHDLIPKGLQHSSGNDLEYLVGTLAAGMSQDVKLTLTAAQIGETVNRVVVNADGGVFAEAEAAVEIVGTRLVLTRTGPKRRFLRRPAVYTNTVTNTSDRPLDGATLLETIPPGMDFVEASDGGQYNAAKRTVAWRVGRLGPRESKSFKVRLLTKTAGTQNSVVRVVDSSGQSVETRSQTKVKGFVALSLDVPAIEGPVEVSQRVAFRVIVRNRGTVAGTNVKIRLTIPEELELVSAKGPTRFRRQGKTLFFAPIATIASRNQATFDVTLKASRQGDARVLIQIEADQMKRPLNREEAILILSGRP